MRAILVGTLLVLASAGHSTAQDRFINIFQAWQIMNTPEVSQSPPGTSQILIDQIETWLSASRQEAPLPVPLSTADLLASIVVSPNPTTTGNAPPTGQMTTQEKYDALAAKGIFPDSPRPDVSDEALNRAQFAKVAALLLTIEPGGTASEGGPGNGGQFFVAIPRPPMPGGPVPDDLTQFISRATGSGTLTGLESPEIMLIVIMKMLGVDGDENPELRAQLESMIRNGATLADLGLVRPNLPQAPGGANAPGQKVFDLSLTQIAAEEEKRKAEERQRAVALALQSQALFRAEQEKKPSIWPAWLGAIPSYSAAYSEVAPAVLAGYRAEYTGEARGTDAEGRPLVGGVTIMFSPGAADSVDMDGALMGLEFTANLTHASNQFGADLDNGVVDLTTGIETYCAGGRIDGKFYGAGHENVAGTFSLIGDTTSNVSGHFAGVGN